MTFNSLLILVLVVIYFGLSFLCCILHRRCNEGFEQICKKFDELEEKLKQLKTEKWVYV